MYKADLHVHTHRSMDCNSKIDAIIERCATLEINCIAIADHGTIEGALELAARTSMRVIIAQEILTPIGEIMGMFLIKNIPSPSSMQAAIDNIKIQGGLVCIPHPYDLGRGNSSLKHESIIKIIDQVDIVEIYNSRSTPVESCDKALILAREHNLPGTAGSDAHTISEIGKTHLILPEFHDAKGFINSLKEASLYSQHSGTFVHILSSLTKIRKRITKKHQ